MSDAFKKSIDIQDDIEALEKASAEVPVFEDKKDVKGGAPSFIDGILSLKNDNQFGNKYKRTESNEKNTSIQSESNSEDTEDLNHDDELSPSYILSLKPQVTQSGLKKEVEKEKEKNEEKGEEKLNKSQKIKNKRKNNIFYKVNNHQELFKVGSSFMADYENGICSFAISSTGYQTSQQKMILGLASFFDHKEDIKIAIVSDNLFDGLFHDIIKSSSEETLQYDSDGAFCKVYIFHNHFEFVCLDSLLEQNHQDEDEDEDKDYEEGIIEFKSHYDIVLWDVPELHKIQLNPEIYYPMIMNFDCLSIIVAQALSRKEDIEELRSFFSGYGINLKGLLIDKDGKENKSELTNKKKPWWRFFW